MRQTLRLVCSLGSLLLLFSCGKAGQPAQEAPIMDSVVVETVPVTDSAKSTDSPTPCPDNPGLFRQQMGIGIMNLGISPGDSLVFHVDANRKSDSVVLKLMDDRGWHILTRGIPVEDLDWFREATELEHYMAYWTSVGVDSVWNEVRLSEQHPALWLQGTPGARTHFLTWEHYLRNQRVRLSKPIYASPDFTSEQVRDTTTAYLYKIEQVQGIWAQVAPIPPGENSSWPGPEDVIGWTPWYCGDSLSIVIYDDYMMEGY